MPVQGMVTGGGTDNPSLQPMPAVAQRQSTRQGACGWRFDSAWRASKAAKPTVNTIVNNYSYCNYSNYKYYSSNTI